MKQAILTGFLLLLLKVSHAQGQIVLTIDEVYEMARQHYPLMQTKDLISKSREFSIENAFKAYYPKVSIAGQATYQSEVTRIPLEMPDMHFEAPAKDQYKMYAEINQTLYDGGRIRNKVQLEKALASTEEQQLQVRLYQLKDRIHQLFFGILLIERQLEQTELTRREIESGINKTKGAIESGTALKSNLQAMEAALLRFQQAAIELKASRQAYTDMLRLFINLPEQEKIRLKMPESEGVSNLVNRPEIKLFDFQKKALDVRKRMISTNIQPQVGFFFQGGYGRPALNMLSNEFEPYYISGIRFNWLFSSFYTNKNEKQLLSLNQQMLDIEKETFLFDTNLSLYQQNAEIHKLEELIKTDKEILALRTAILTTASAQIENGTITAHDYLSQVIAEEEARQNLLLHQVQLQMAKYKHNTIAGN